MTYRMRKRWPVLGIVVLVCAVVVLYFACFSSVEKQAYQNVLARANPSLLLEAEKKYQARQLRKGVQKNFWYKKGGERLEVILMSDNAEMVFEKQGKSQQIVEHMTKVKGYIQERIYYESADEGQKPVQSIRYFEADTARYHYVTETLEADRVKMLLFIAPGHRLEPPIEQLRPVMESYAEKVELFLVDGTLHCKTNKFTGHFVQ